MSQEKPLEIIVVGQEEDGRLIFYMNDKFNRMKATKEEMEGLADYKRADISWMIVPNTDLPAKNDSPL